MVCRFVRPHCGSVLEARRLAGHILHGYVRAVRDGLPHLPLPLWLRLPVLAPYPPALPPIRRLRLPRKKAPENLLLALRCGCPLVLACPLVRLTELPGRV